ncbi:GOLPH3/VPS74 family protein [Glycomyces harbinensis]|uniref:Golgi phosphoprotein 3 (GPP34) n=1 Tax=Glycomyces harbinensis TaxID=58114 RepID=A0A1G6R3P9_9ACTN|nr:GPP34 family phosphoprotein [Glycomyces harbinensis]SDC98695.1 Golgi phosphoprotein 3 (GPP34) [Glycomyces harbinensis]
MPDAPAPRLVYDALLITSHHDFYKPAVAPRVAELGLGAALVAELVLSGHLAVWSSDGSKLAPRDIGVAPPTDSLGLWLTELVRAEPEPLPVPEWLDFLAVSDLYAKTADHMVTTGLMHRTERRSRWRKASQVSYEPADALVAQAPLARIRRHLSSMEHRMPLADAFLVALTEAVGLSKSLYSQTPYGAREYALSHTRSLPAPLQSVHGHLAAAVADTAITGNF